MKITNDRINTYSYINLVYYIILMAHVLEHYEYTTRLPEAWQLKLNMDSKPYFEESLKTTNFIFHENSAFSAYTQNWVRFPAFSALWNPVLVLCSSVNVVKLKWSPRLTALHFYCDIKLHEVLRLALVRVMVSQKLKVKFLYKDHHNYQNRYADKMSGKNWLGSK